MFLFTPLARTACQRVSSHSMSQGLSPSAAVMRLRERQIIASVAPYAIPHVRLTPCLINTHEEIETVLQEVRGLAA